MERSRTSKARASNSNYNRGVREGAARKGVTREGGRADTDSGIHSSSSSFLEPARGGQSFYRSYYWPSCCREAYGHPQFYPPHPYYSRQAALSWQHLLLTTLPPAYLRMPPQTGTFPRTGGSNPGSKWSNNSRYSRRTSEHWGRMRQGRSMPNLSSSSSESSEEDEEREWEEEEVEVHPEVRSSCVSKVRAHTNTKKSSSTTIKVQSQTFSQRIPQHQGTVRSVPEKFDKWTSEPIFV